jgi:hypothetical protein
MLAAIPLTAIAISALVSCSGTDDVMDALTGKCGGQSYNSDTHYCMGGTIVEKVGDGPGSGNTGGTAGNKFNGKYCDFGACKNGDGWNCEEGGCYGIGDYNTLTDANCVEFGGEVKTTCPTASLPPAVKDGERCLWNAGGDCWSIDANKKAECAEVGWIFNGGFEGEGTLCNGGTFSGVGKDQNPPKQALPSIGCCDWGNKNACYDVYYSEDVGYCQNASNTFYSGKCPDKQGTCPGGNSSGDGLGPCKTPNGQQLACQWDEGCHLIDSQYSPTNETCDEIIIACGSTRLYVGVTTGGNGTQCSARGGTLSTWNLGTLEVHARTHRVAICSASGIVAALLLILGMAIQQALLALSLFQIAQAYILALRD